MPSGASKRAPQTRHDQSAVSVPAGPGGKRGRYVLATLPQRVDNQKMPVMRIVDMRQEAIRQKKQHVLSRKLFDAIAARLAKSEQVILFLNRRGYATHMFCPKCGYVAMCSNCSVTLTYHRKAAVALALKGVAYRAIGAGALLQRNLMIYGLGGIIIPFIGIKAIDLVVAALHLV